MDKVTEEVLTSIIKRMEAIEQKVGIGQIPQAPTTPTQSRGDLATSGQIWRINKEGGKVWPGMTKKEASALIDRLSKKNESPKEPKQEEKAAPQNYEVPADLSKLTEEEIKELESNGSLL